MAASATGSLVINLGCQGPGAVRVAVDLGHQSVHEFDLNAALGVALLAGGVDLVFRQVLQIGVPNGQA